MEVGAQTITINRPKYRSSRPHDYVYDPDYYVSSKTAHHRAAFEAQKVSADIKVVPKFRTMFSELVHYPRSELLVTGSDQLPPFVDNSWEARERAQGLPALKVDVNGTDRHKFYRRAIVPFLHPVIPCVRFAKDLQTIQRQLEAQKPPVYVPARRTRGTQTKYRDSEAQTDPYSPDYVIRPGHNPEVLTIAHFSCGNGLPAGIHEVEVIERMRYKREWEKRLPPLDCEENIKKRRQMMVEMEADEWAFRDREIQDVHDLRLELVEKLIAERDEIWEDRLTKRVVNKCTAKESEKERKLQKIRTALKRDLRKLSFKHRGVTRKFKKSDVLKEYTDFTDALYAPQLRFGEQARRRHEKLHLKSKFLTHYKGLGILESEKKWLSDVKVIKHEKPKPTDELCVRETRWTPARLAKIYQDFKAYREGETEVLKPLALITRFHKPLPHPPTPSVDAIPDWEEDFYQACVLLQKVIKGRAVQVTMYEGRKRCQELIEELRSTHALQEAGRKLRTREKFEVLNVQREYIASLRKNEQLSEVMSNIEGETIGEMLDFLTKELVRLQEERRIHAMALVAERERQAREAMEAGRRQAEERERRENDEIFKHILKIHHSTVDMFLEDVITDTLDCTGEENAHAHVRKVAKKIESTVEEMHKKSDILGQNELIADTVHNFIIPEVEKLIVRKKIKQKQSAYLRAAHNVIYDEDDETNEEPEPPEPFPQESDEDEESEENLKSETSAPVPEQRIECSVNVLQQEISQEADARTYSDEPTEPKDQPEN